ncbi:hypothetical protein P9112_003559 [Eukaryota sp. TZLM1-RC]
MSKALLLITLCFAYVYANTTTFGLAFHTRNDYTNTFLQMSSFHANGAIFNPNNCRQLKPYAPHCIHWVQPFSRTVELDFGYTLRNADLSGTLNISTSIDYRNDKFNLISSSHGIDTNLGFALSTNSFLFDWYYGLTPRHTKSSHVVPRQLSNSDFEFVFELKGKGELKQLDVDNIESSLIPTSAPSSFKVVRAEKDHFGFSARYCSESRCTVISFDLTADFIEVSNSGVLADSHDMEVDCDLEKRKVEIRFAVNDV